MGVVGLGYSLAELDPDAQRVGAAGELGVEGVSVAILVGIAEVEEGVVERRGGREVAGIHAAGGDGAVGHDAKDAGGLDEDARLADSAGAHIFADTGVDVAESILRRGIHASGAEEGMPVVGLIARLAARLLDVEVLEARVGYLQDGRVEEHVDIQTHRGKGDVDAGTESIALEAGLEFDGYRGNAERGTEPHLVGVAARGYGYLLGSAEDGLAVALDSLDVLHVDGAHVEFAVAVGHHEVSELKFILAVILTYYLNIGLLITGRGAVEHHGQTALVIGGCRTNSAGQGSTKCK